MSENAFKIYETAVNEQHSRNEARRIRTRVNEARQNPHSAGLRWPFELLQNALDAGARSGRAEITVRLYREASSICFEHDGAPFQSEDLAALLSGGSNKEFESEFTTGRFGTGFLVTHVLAETTTLGGILALPTGYEKFELILDRSGDEARILENIHACNDAIRAAEQVSDVDSLPSAKFQYPLEDNDSSLTLGVHSLRKALPYLYATRESLGPVEIRGIDGAETWIPSRPTLTIGQGGKIEAREIRVETENCSVKQFEVFKFTAGNGSAGSALVLVEKSDGCLDIVFPSDESPKIYREYPLRSSGFLPLNFVLDGKFSPDQERARLLMNDQDKSIINECFKAIIVGIKYAFANEWKGRHLLAKASKPDTVFDPNSADEVVFWGEQLATLASDIARLPIVETILDFLPAAPDSEVCADFVAPRLKESAAQNETSVERLWHLVADSAELYPPKIDIASDWTEITRGWGQLGIETHQVDVQELVKYVRPSSNILDELKVRGDATGWLARFLDVVGECWETRAGVDISVLEKMLPNQSKRLRSPSELHRDGGIANDLKDICADLGLDVRGSLLFNLAGVAVDGSLSFLSAAIAKAVPSEDTPRSLVERTASHIGTLFPENKEIGSESIDQQIASIRFFDHVFPSYGEDHIPLLRQLPLFTLNNRVARWGRDRMMMAPVSHWNAAAQPFHICYPPSRILSDIYVRHSNVSEKNIIAKMVDLGVAYSDPIISERISELKERRLQNLSDIPTEGITVTDEVFSQIALLTPEVLNRCQEGLEEAQALLGLVLCYIAPLDPEWERKKIVNGRKGREDLQISLRGAIWLADLKVRAWVPVAGEGERPDKMGASRTTLEPLLKQSWLEKNDAAIRLLSAWFDFDELELRLLATAPDPDKRRELRNGLARLVETGGGDASVYNRLAEQIQIEQQRSRDVNRCRRFGIAVQNAVKVALENRGLTLELVDRGFDYRVEFDSLNLIEDGSTKFEVGPYLLEVKATTSGKPRLTPLQADTASAESERYVLCVVDLQAVSEEELDQEWTSERIELLASIMPSIGSRVEETCALVRTARTRSVGIRNETALRYEVPSSLWKSGVTISNWVEGISAHL